MVKLTVVIPHLNYGRYLRECLESLEAQTFKDYEAVLVDGGSTDNTFEVLKDFPFVKVLVDVPAVGPVHAVNKAIEVMEGDYFHQLNSDCVLDTVMYEKCVDFLDHVPYYGMVYTSWRMIDDDGGFLGYARQPYSFNRNRLLRGNYIDASSMVIRRKCFDVVGVFDERCPWSMDWIMASKISSLFRVWFLDEPLFSYRVHRGQVTEEKSKREFLKARKIVEGYFGGFDRLEARLITKAKEAIKKVIH